MSALSGAAIEGDAHLAQSIADILTTPIGTRPMRRDYGSLLFQLIDAPLNAVTRMQFIAATIGALARWEPRIRVTRANVAAASAQGTVHLDLEYERADVPGPNAFGRLTLPLRFGRPSTPTPA